MSIHETKGAKVVFGHDNAGQTMVEWSYGGYWWKRAWIQTNRTKDKDYANVQRYFQVVRKDPDRPGIGGNPTDFPILDSVSASDEQLLIQFIITMAGITGNSLPPVSEWEGLNDG